MSYHNTRRAIGWVLLSVLNSPMFLGSAYGDEAPIAVGSMTLADVERRALAANADVIAARLAVNGATAEITTAGEVPNPQFSVSTTGNSIGRGFGSVVNWDQSVDAVMRLDQQIERGDKRSLRIQAAKSAASAAESGVTDTLRSVRQQVDEAYFDLKYAQEAVSVYRSLLAIERQSLEAAQLQLEAGGVSAVDVARLKIEVVRSQTDENNAEMALRNAQLVLAQLMGTAVDSNPLRATDDWPAVMATPVEPNAALDQRPDIMAAQARIQQAQQAQQLARAQRTRDISVGLQYEHNMTGTSAPNAWTVSVTIPLFLRSKYEGEIVRATVDLEIAKESLHRTSSKAAFELQQAASELNNATLRLKSFQSEVSEQARAAAEAAEYAYQHGASSLTDLLDARRVSLAINLDILDAHNAYAKALADWRAATSSGNEVMSNWVLGNVK
jgi:outer membrane protein, heavy metal efflux system